MQNYNTVYLTLSNLPTLLGLPCSFYLSKIWELFSVQHIDSVLFKLLVHVYLWPWPHQFLLSVFFSSLWFLLYYNIVKYTLTTDSLMRIFLPSTCFWNSKFNIKSIQKRVCPGIVFFKSILLLSFSTFADVTQFYTMETKHI